MHGVPNKALQFANCESFLENCKSKLPFFWEIANQLFLMFFFFFPNCFTCFAHYCNVSTNYIFQKGKLLKRNW